VVKDQSGKRKYIRINIDKTVKYAVQEKNKFSGKKSTAFIKDLSVEGACLVSKKNIDLGTIIKLELSVLSETDPIYLAGEVRWARFLKETSGKDAFEIGVKFITVDSRAEDRFTGYMCDTMVKNLNKYLKS